MKDLDKIKELVATCDSQNIELAIALGVNMEGYDREKLEEVIISCIVNNVDIIKDGMTVYGIPLFICVIQKDMNNVFKTKNFSYKAFGGMLAFYRAALDSYLSL